MLEQNVGEQTRCIMGNVKMANTELKQRSFSEQLTSTGSGHFGFSGSALGTTLSNTNLVASRHIEMEIASLPVDLRSSRTLVLKLLR